MHVTCVTSIEQFWPDALPCTADKFSEYCKLVYSVIYHHYCIPLFVLNRCILLEKDKTFCILLDTRLVCVYSLVGESRKINERRYIMNIRKFVLKQEIQWFIRSKGED